MTYPLHEKALSLAKQYMSSEISLIGCLIQIEKEKLHSVMGYSSLYKYATLGLLLSEDRAATLIQIARKSTEVPELEIAIKTQALSITKARRIATVLTKENSTIWIKKALELPRQALEQELVKEFPDRM